MKISVCIPMYNENRVIAENARALSEYMEKSFEIFKYMKGGIASYRDGIIKPGREIFELFLKRFGKHAEECVFVDDSPNNTESARNIGYSTVTLKNMDDLEEELSKFPDLHKILDNGI